ncbi:MAG: hypothetical protein IKV52_05090 [Oscillospiraceae bacterium]|nr:hypothetical protein [Oscillospiraceae bacterium]
MTNKLSNDIKKLIKTLCLLALFMAVIWGVSFAVDPANIATSGYARNVAEIMISGQHATNMQNLDDRALIEEYFSLRKDAVSTLVLGSSRSMQITPQLTGDPDTFCAGVTGADLRDSISTYMLLREKDLLPQKVIFCAEYWFLSGGNLDSRALTEGYYDFCQQTGNTAHKSDSRFVVRMKELLGFSYFQSSIDLLLSGKDTPVVATDAADNLLATRRSDGSYSYEQSYREGGVEQSDRFGQESTIYNQIASYFDGVDPQLEKQLEDFVDMMLADGVQVVIQLSPFHPIYYTHMTQTESFADILATEDYFYSFAQDRGIDCYGGYNPDSFGMTSIDFYDAQHPTAQGIYKYYGAEN